MLMYLASFLVGIYIATFTLIWFFGSIDPYGKYKFRYALVWFFGSIEPYGRFKFHHALFWPVYIKKLFRG